PERVEVDPGLGVGDAARVGEVGDHHPAAGLDQDPVELEPAMADPGRVHRREPGVELQGHVDDLDRARSLVPPLAQAHALDVLGGQVAAPPVLADVVGARDVAMGHASRQPGLTAKLLELVVAELLADLVRDDLADRVIVGTVAGRVAGVDPGLDPVAIGEQLIDGRRLRALGRHRARVAYDLAMLDRLRSQAVLVALLGAALLLPGSAAGVGSITPIDVSISSTLWAATGEREPFVYSIAMPDPHRHEFHVSLEFSDLPGERATVELPKWNPGAYRLTDAHRNVRAVVAR